jgi:hypothetical protein
MKPLRVDDILPLAEYARRRDDERRRLIELRRRRRLQVGPSLSLGFENRDTLRYQVQEMCHAEGLGRPEQVAHEVETYNALIPGPGELTATLLIELAGGGDPKAELDRFLGLDRDGVVTMRAGLHTVPVAWEEGHSEEDRIAAVQYVRFRLSPAAQAALRAGEESLVLVAHPRYQQAARIGDDLRRELVADLDG